MNIIVNYPTEKDAIESLSERVAEFKAILVFESIKRLNITEEGKRKVTKELLKGVKS